MSSYVNVGALPSASAAQAVKLDKFKLGVLSFGHLVADMYYATLFPLWPLLIDSMALSLTDVGFFTSLTCFMLLPVQPFIGGLVDRFPRAWFMILGLIGAALGMSFIGLAPTYTLLMVCVVFGRFSAAIFHPQAAVMVRATSGGRHGAAMSIFTFAGNIGLAVGPLLSIGVVTLFGLDFTYLMIPFGLIAAAAIYYCIGVDVPKESPASASKDENGSRPASIEQTFVGPLLLLTVLMTFRAAIWIGFRTFLPIYLVDNRAMPLLIGVLGLSALTLSGALGGLLGGHLSDRYSGSWVIAISLLMSALSICAFVRTDGLLSLLMLIVAGMFLFVSEPVATVLAQEHAPDRTAMVSGVMMGMVWGIGALFVTPIGMLSDVFGLSASMYALAGLAALTGLGSFFLPEFRQRYGSRLRIWLALIARPRKGRKRVYAGAYVRL